MSQDPLEGYARSATRLLPAMSRSTSGWSAQHVETLLMGFGFSERDSGAHTFYRHPVHPELALAVPRSRRLRPCLVADAVRLVARVLAIPRESK